MSEERREFFRIDDQIALEYRVIGEADVEAIRNKIEAAVPDKFMTASSFAATSRQIGHLLHRLQAQSPELVRCLQAIDQKLNTLAQLFVAEEMKLETQPTREVNISAGGLAFRSQQQIPVGELLEMRMVLLPSLMGILTVARVVKCEHVNDGQLQFPWRIAVTYEHIRESDRELLVRHIMARETELLRAQRSGGGD
ncbi:MAG TPA: PilZ domain-containing protein [Gammaproteobacteria bacterium]|nr:PilZ domain-containing protein [Gammaproteobacteria bacterium]